ncbi:MAG: SDR family NAD(P)-dependent oxidoreductase [Chloroflexia bacterium]|nr:SDR family NAD(P)-dependent oxidoreductase [Chloroflexia bacterium]
MITWGETGMIRSRPLLKAGRLDRDLPPHARRHRHISQRSKTVRTTYKAEKENHMDGIRGKNVLVTGGSSGIGQAIAVRLGLEGANVAINYRKGEEEAEATHAQIHAAIEECGRQIETAGAHHILVQADVAKEDDIRTMMETTVRELGGLDMLINNAGIQSAADSHELTVEQYDRVMTVNARGAFLCAREAIRHVLAERKPGVIINMSSVHQLIPKPRFLSYAMSKGAMQNLTRPSMIVGLPICLAGRCRSSRPKSLPAMWGSSSTTPVRSSTANCAGSGTMAPYGSNGLRPLRVSGALAIGAVSTAPSLA